MITITDVAKNRIIDTEVIMTVQNEIELIA